MKVLLVNGSPHEKGCTYTAISEVADTLQKEGIDTDIFWIGKKSLSGCVACGGCKKIGKCVFNDTVNEFMNVATDYDGFIFGSPVHFAAMDGAMKSFMDRAFFSNMGREKNAFMLKPVAAVVSARRAGTTAALDQMNKYFAHGQMPIISSRYWNMVHGNSPEEVRQDYEGMQIMRVLGRNMAWFLKLVEAGEKLSVERPKQEDRRISTNFIR